jgi:5-oxoprolinase (ATP-hydrolysing) subunit A
MRPSFAPLGDTVVLVTLGDGIDERLSARIRALGRSLDRAGIDGVREWVPGYVSLAVHHDPVRIGYTELCGILADLAEAPADPDDEREPALHEIHVRYGGADGPDLGAVAAHAGIPASEVIARHCRPIYRVALLGFLPGFPYLAGLDPSIAAPRLAEPRQHVAAGSVGIGGSQTGVYPLASPGGWCLIGRTDARLFDPGHTPPTLLAPGDRVRFVPIGRRRIDLNADLGEGAGCDAEILDAVSSASVACGGHAGDEHTMRRAVALAAARRVAVGAHPGFPDRDGFGRRETPVERGAVADLVASQVRSLHRIAAAAGVALAHVKPHGALYNLAARDPAIGGALIEGVLAAGACRTLFVLAGSALAGQARAAGLTVVEEAFADRGYRGDGSLVPRGSPGDLVDDPAEAARRAVRIAIEGAVTAVDGGRVTVAADTICVHGDSPHALESARAVAEALRRAGVEIGPPGAASGPDGGAR